jgi:zinc/manganese transport system ATP-binding protein
VDSIVDAAVSFEDLTVRYADRVAVRCVSATIATGTLTALIGPNGAGKSTLLNVVTGMKRAEQGRVILSPHIDGRIAYLPQQSALDRSFPINVLDLVALGAWQRVRASGRIGRPEQQRACDALAAVGLAGLERRPRSPPGNCNEHCLPAYCRRTRDSSCSMNPSMPSMLVRP